MVGLGESKEEIIETMQHMRDHQIDMLTIGQYLAPSKSHLPVKRYVEPAEFDEYSRIAKELGFVHAACGPFGALKLPCRQTGPRRAGEIRGR